MTAEPPIVRSAGRVIVVDRGGRILLFRGGDPSRPQDGTWWFTPGGGAGPGETVEDAARRELREETGLSVVELGPVVYVRETRFAFDGRRYEQREQFHRIVVDPFDVDTSGWTDLERRAMVEHRWWTLEELRSTPDTFYPENLVELVTTS